jgi:two-component system, sensor histidine kinase LadS
LRRLLVGRIDKAIKLISRFTLCMRWSFVVMVALLAVGGTALADVATDSVRIEGLPGLTVDALSVTTDGTALQPPSLANSDWQVLTQPLGQGFGEQVYWVRLVLGVPDLLLNAPMVLRFHPPNARDVQFFLPNGDVIALGTDASFEQRALGFPDLAASFVPVSTSTVIDVRLATAGRIFGTFEVMSERAYYQSQAWRTAMHGVFYGMLLLALVVNFLNWVTTRQGIYGLYVGFVGFSLFASLAVNGYLHALVLGSWTAHHSTIQLWVFAGMAATAIGFAARMLRLRAWHVWLEKGADFLAVTLLVLAVLASLWITLRAYVWEFVLFAFMAYGTVAMVASARYWWQSRSLQTSLLALAFLVFALSQWVSMGTVFGLLPATPVNVGMWQIGLVIHLVLLQMALVINHRQSRWRDWQQQARLDALKAQADTEARRSRDLQLFLERLTHEFKTPLAVIDSSVQSLGMLEHEHDPQRDLRYDRIRRAVTRLNDLLMRSVVAEKAMLSLPRGERQLLDLPALLEAVLVEFTSIDLKCKRDCLIALDQYPNSARQHQHRMRLSWNGYERPESLLIDAQASWLHAALYHVFDNAVKYSIEEEDIVVEIHAIEPDDGSPCVVITITNACDVVLVDSDLPRLFDKYYRKGEQDNVPGAGIGLYVARQAIEAHGGTLTVRLLGPKQIQFRIELPQAIADNQPR